MRKVISFTHMSLDGYIAGPNGEMDWIVYNETLAADAGELSHQADAALYGRVTYQMMEGYWPTVLTEPNATPQERDHAAWVDQVHKIVFSRTLDKVDWHNTTLIKTNIGEELMKYKAGPGGNMLIFGSPRLTRALAELGLIDEYRINLNPVTIGRGAPLFRPDQINKLQLLESRPFDCGVIGLRYAVVK